MGDPRGCKWKTRSYQAVLKNNGTARVALFQSVRNRSAGVVQLVGAVAVAAVG
eukprot:SAG31_NODE_35201_length_325_cov_0.911504_1_plen_52_part_01